MSKPFRVVQIGMRHEHATGKIWTLRHFKDEFEVVGVVDDRAAPTPAVDRTNYSDFDGIPIISEEEALNDPSVEAVLVEVSNAALVETGLRVAAAGKPMHLDKPTGETLQPFVDLVELCRAKKIALQPGYMFRANPAVLFAQKAVKEGWLGEVISVEADMNHSYGDLQYQDYLGTFKAGILYNLGCHIVDLIMPMMPGLPTRATPFLHTAPGDRDGIANTCVSVLEWPHATATIHASSRARKAQPMRRLRVLGTKGWIEVCPIELFGNDPELLEMQLSEPAGGYEAGHHTVNFGPREDRYIGQLRELKQIVRGEIPAPDNYDNEILVHKAVLMSCGLM